jgi:hypothetical protein
VRSSSIVLSESLIRSDKFLSKRIDFAESVATDAANFPHVKFWFRSDWLSNKEVKDFVETECGNIMNQDQMKEI